MSGHGKGRVKSIPKADNGIGKRVSQIVLKMSGNFSFLNAVIPEVFLDVMFFFLFVIPIADVGCQKRVVKVGLSRLQKLIGELASV